VKLIAFISQSQLLKYARCQSEIVPPVANIINIEHFRMQIVCLFANHSHFGANVKYQHRVAMGKWCNAVLWRIAATLISDYCG